MADLNEHEFASTLRGKIFAGAIIVVFLGFLVRFVQLQIIEGPALRGAAIEQGLKKIERVPVRGTIYDRRGRVVAASVPSFSVAVTRQDFDPYRAQTLPLLARILGVDTNYILERINQGGFYTRFQPIKVWRDADPRIIAQIEERQDQLPGVDIVSESKREYVAPIRASHLLGYTKEISEAMLDRLDSTADSEYYHPGDVVGTTGLEQVHERELRGTKGYEFLAVDAKGQKQARLNRGLTDIPGIDGANIQLGMDIDLQEYAEQLLSPYHGAIVALDPRNGDILALVSKPDFDLDVFSGKTTKKEYQAVMLDPDHPLYNRATQTRYPPGSTWKLMMAAACLTTKTIPFDFKLTCPGSFTFGNHTYKDDQVHGVVDVHQSIVRSCDVFYYRMILKLGIDSMYKYAREFGFDQPTGVDIGHEGSGYIPNTKRMNKLYPHGWTLGYVVSQGIGQGEIGVTPIQQAAYMATWANHGVWVEPHAAHRIYNMQSGTWDTVAYKSRRLDVPDTVIETVRRAMLGVVNEPGGTAHQAAIPNSSILIAGKTGTAQNPHGKDHAWFDCFAPYDHPKIAICVLVENAGFGGVVSAPIARKLINYYLTGTREDPTPSIVPNTPAYEAWKMEIYGGKSKGARKDSVGTSAPSVSARPTSTKALQPSRKRHASRSDYETPWRRFG
ncbi:MAG: penicillin-binding protein 2 [Bacteroidota bacterium]|nr:penicillin-binding protein 2 [Bacteroidota bacterium]MDP4234687.1 penicillin-binding protein 2 [Bacteroidota bacterium]MDP4243910.1 penicillin-binding protein 2 [Bacteroidota bacterium]MDP4288867.1 penicillin-binding protein 2 [Bacteroidota bacterium]